MKNKKSKIILILILTVISVLFIAPIVIVFMNSFKSKLFINSTPFAFPNADSFVGLANYGEGMIKTGFLQAFFITLFITVASVFLIVVLTSMTAWYNTIVNNSTEERRGTRGAFEIWKNVNLSTRDAS